MLLSTSLSRNVMAKHVIVAVTMLLFGIPQMGRSEDNGDSLDRIVGVTYSFHSFNEAVQEIETKTGYKTKCSQELAKFMQSLFMGRGAWDPKNPGPEPKQTVRAFLDHICGQISVSWQLDSSSTTLLLDLLWKTSDTRSAADLLKFIDENTPSDRSKHDSPWQKAFDALVSKPQNIEKAWRVRQAAAIEEKAFIPRSLMPVLIKPVISSSLQKYHLILINHPIFCYPGHGSASYYCFKEDGTLAVAGLMNTGHRCALVDSTVDNEIGERSGFPSEIHMILKMNLRNIFIARFHLEEDGLKLFSLVDAYGAPVNNDGLNIGVSLLK